MPQARVRNSPSRARVASRSVNRGAFFFGSSQANFRAGLPCLLRATNRIISLNRGSPGRLLTLLFLPRPSHETIAEFHETIFAFAAILPKPPPSRPGAMELRRWSSQLARAGFGRVPMIYTQVISASPARVPAVVQDTSDETLVAQIAQRDKRALQQLYSPPPRPHLSASRCASSTTRPRPRIRSARCSSTCGGRPSASKRRSQVTTWLLAIARNKALSMLRRRSNEELDDEVAEFIEDPADNPEITMQKSQRAHGPAGLPDAAVARAPRDRRPRLLSREVDRRGRRDHRVPANTVKTRMFYARKRIGELMAAKGINRAQI